MGKEFHAGCHLSAVTENTKTNLQFQNTRHASVSFSKRFHTAELITSITNILVCRRNNTVFQQGSMNPITKNPTLYWYTILFYFINLWNKTIYKLVLLRHLNICSSIICNIVLWLFFCFFSFFCFFLNGSYFYTKLWFKCGGEQPPPPFRVLIIRQTIRLPIIRQNISYSSVKI